MYIEQKANGALTRENQNANNKNAEKCIKTIRPKLQLIVSEKKKLREVVKREGRFPYIYISTPKLWNCENIGWLNRFLL